MRIIFNQKQQKEFRQFLRNNSTSAETKLWYFLRNKKLVKNKFRRQYGIDKYVVDFYCPKLKLAIEVDGDSHFTNRQITRDNIRKKYIESLGIQVLRFTNTDIYENIEEVIKRIIDFTKPPLTPP